MTSALSASTARRTEQLNELARLALADFHHILAVPLHERPNSEWPMWLRAKIRASAYILSAKLRVDEASLRHRVSGLLAGFLAVFL
jgi:hypothetical protein